MADEYDCQQCGACCIPQGTSDGTGYIPLGRAEARSLRRRGLAVVEAALGGLSLPCRPHEGAGGRVACVAFEGQVGGACACSAYDDRPAVCRHFAVGGELCRQARAQEGLPA